MRYAFARSFRSPAHAGIGGCIPCGSAGSTLATTTPDAPTGNTRAIATGVFVTSVLVGGVGFAASAPIASTVGLFGVIGSMLVLAMQPTPVEG